MSLFKQLLLLITAIILVIFTVNFFAGVNNTRSYLQIESGIHAQDTATSLGLSLSPYMMDQNDPMLQTIINAIFDRGYYKEIKLVNMEDKVLVQVFSQGSFEEVPDWFIKYLPMETASAETEISSGWNIAGKLYVSTNPGYGHLKLYEQASIAFKSSLLAFLIFTLLLFFLLRIILHPLKKIEHMARNIAKGQFDTISKIPWTTEIKNVSVAMNFMSKKIEQMISNLNSKLDKVGQQLQLDELTGLKNKSSFESDMKRLFMSHAEGYVFFIKIDNLGEFAERQGREAVDNFLKEFANVLKETIQFNNNEFSAYRFYGSEFALIASSLSGAQVESSAKQLSESFIPLAQKINKIDITHIGIVAFDVGSTIPGILTAAREAYEQAHLIGANAYYIHKPDKKARDVSEWLALVEQVINEKQYKVQYISQVYALRDDSGVVMEEAFAQIFDKDEPVPIGTFISIAEKHGQIINLDKGITSQVVDHIAKEGIQYPISINLSMTSVKNTEFCMWLEALLEKHKDILDKIVFSITAYSVAKDIEQFKKFIVFAHNLGAKVLLKRYESQLISLEQIKILKPDYLRLARELTADINSNNSKRLFVETMKEVSDLLDVKVIAENVKSDNDFELLKKIKIYGASR